MRNILLLMNRILTGTVSVVNLIQIPDNDSNRMLFTTNASFHPKQNKNHHFRLISCFAKSIAIIASGSSIQVNWITPPVTWQNISHFISTKNNRNDDS
jgi:hypothetical protein